MEQRTRVPGSGPHTHSPGSRRRYPAHQILSIVLYFHACAAYAQTPLAPGTIRAADPQGLPTPNVRVQVRNNRTGQSLTCSTNSDGSCEIAPPELGLYRASVQGGGLQGKVEFTYTGSAFDVTVPLTTTSVSATLDVVERLSEVSGSVTKSDVRLLETPQSISIIGRESLTEQAPLTVQDALRYSAGIRTEQYGFDARGDWASIRGGSFGQFLNGLRMLFGYYNNVRPEPFTLEQIEVMRGPSSVLFGQGGFGGVINLVTKRPSPQKRGEIAIQAGTFGRKQVGVDLTGAADSEGKWLYRFVGVGRDSDTQVKYVPDDRLVIAPSVTWRPADSTRLTILSNFQEDRMGSSVGFFPWRGTLQAHPLGQIATSTFISEPGFDEYNTSQRSAGYLFEHRAGSRWTIRQNFNYSQSTASYQSLYSAFSPRPLFNADDRTINRVIYLNKPVANSPTIDTHAETRFRTGLIQHSLLTGFDYQQASITGSTAFGDAPAIDVFEPRYGNYTVPTLAPFAKSRQNQRGVYAQDQLKIGEHLSATIGIRKDWAFAETVGSAASRLDSSAVTGRAGLVYVTKIGLAPYFSYTESFLPIAGIDFYNNPYKPQRGKQWEAGAKFESARGRSTVNVAWFDLRETNRRTPDPANARNSIQVGEAQSRGAEFESKTTLFGAVDVIASYTYNLARVTRSNSTDVGRRLATMPLHLASLWATKRFTIRRGHALMFGPGIRYTGSSFDGNDELRTPSYTLFDLMGAYDTGRWRFSANAANLGDRTHVTACLARGDCFYGMRRTVIVTLGYRF